jgi:hypothetical protein
VAVLRAVLLVLHVAGGTVALGALVPVLISTKGRGLHRRAGLVYVWGMVGVLGTAYPLAFLLPSPFLGGVALFSTYLVGSGWRWIRRDAPTTVRLGRGLAAGMLAAAVAMVAVGAMQLADGDGLGTALLAFAAIGSALALEDLAVLRGERSPRSRRIALHLGRMLGGGIATVTAVLVVNVSTDPVWVAWLAPTIVGTPMIAWWTTRTLRPTGRATGREDRANGQPSGT